MSSIKIDKNVPLAELPKKKGFCKYPFMEMDVGDSIFFDNEPKATKSAPASAAKIHAARVGRKVACRTEGRGVRIHRIA